jgi:DNA repair exonuclease SbcCD ATPase subunit
MLMRLTNYRKEIAIYEKQNHAISQYNSQLNDVQINMGAIRKKIVHLLELNKILDETEEEIFESTIATITDKVNELLENIFDQNPPRLIVKNEVKKTAKTSRDIQFFFATTNDNVSQSDSIRGITTYSGGEADRLSLAFTCAATGFSDCPLLFLDECISSLDTELRDKVIRTLRTVVKEKFVIVVCHDTVDGLFDSVVMV